MHLPVKQVNMKVEEGFFKTYDGLNLFYRFWLADSFRHPVFVMHGLHEHSGRYDRIIQKLNLPDFSFFSFDQRGHGQSEGPQGYALGVDEYVKDMAYFWEFVTKRYSSIPKTNVIWYGHSFGGLWTVRYALSYPEHVKAVLLSSPCFGIRSWIYLVDHLIASLSLLFPKAVMNSFVYRRLLSHDPEERRLHKEDKLIHNKIGLLLLKDALKIMPETVRQAAQFKKPLMVLVSGKEYVVLKRRTIKFFENAGSQDKVQHIFPEHYHELHREKDWQKPLGLMRDFLLRQSGH